MYVHISIYLEIIANFEETSYRVYEHNGSIEPKLTLSRPSPCDFILHAQLVPLGELIDIHMYLCTYIHILIGCNMAARGSTDIYTR